MTKKRSVTRCEECGHQSMPRLAHLLRRVHEAWVAGQIVLQQLEWDENGQCPMCGAFEWDGHDDKCNLAAALKMGPFDV